MSFLIFERQPDKAHKAGRKGVRGGGFHGISDTFSAENYLVRTVQKIHKTLRARDVTGREINNKSFGERAASACGGNLCHFNAILTTSMKINLKK